MEDLNAYHKGAVCHVTKGGSTVAVTPDCDIIAVCRKAHDELSGADILALAVANGGRKLDSYDGNHKFYIENGFEPVSWCKWEQEYAPYDWDKITNNPENIIFYKYTGKRSKYKEPKEFYKAVPASKDYDTAQAVRDKSMD